jgi:hypothetical protein
MEMGRNVPPPQPKEEMIRINDETTEETIEIIEPRSIYLEPKPIFKAPKQTRRGNVFMLTRPGARDPGLPLMVFDSASERRSSTGSRP